MSRNEMSRLNCECACVLHTEGLMSYLQMYSTEVCYVLFRWDMAWGKTLLCLFVLVLREQQFKERVSWV